MPDYDTHIANLPSDDPRFRYKDTLHEWSEFAYGSKLFKATTVNDPELKKLVALFEWLVPSDESTDGESTDDESRLSFRPQEI